jgi:hypothetical protein
VQAAVAAGPGESQGAAGDHEEQLRDTPAMQVPPYVCVRCRVLSCVCVCVCVCVCARCPLPCTTPVCLLGGGGAQQHV